MHWMKSSWLTMGKSVIGLEITCIVTATYCSYKYMCGCWCAVEGDTVLAVVSLDYKKMTKFNAVLCASTKAGLR